MAKNNFLALCFCLLANLSAAQDSRYFIYFTDKDASPFSTQNPQAFLSARSIERREKQNIAIKERDLPVNPAYLDQVRATGATVIRASRWMNAALITASVQEYAQVTVLPFVKDDIPLPGSAFAGGRTRPKFDAELTGPSYGNSANQLFMLGVDDMHNAGFHGEGMVIAILDAGFFKVNQLPAFDSLRTYDRILSTYDFVDRETDVYDDHSHGMQVLSVVGGYLEGSLVGSAFRAQFHLIRTETDLNETKNEEIYWLFGAEYADSVGADIVSSSLGYYDFDGSADDYSQNQLDGYTALITQAANMAASTGILMVNSAGNEGNNAWRKIAFPADSDSVLVVGGVKANGTYAPLSSVGNTTDGRIKPDIMAQAEGVVVSSTGGQATTSNGTSFSTPMMAGFAAGLWQANPALSPRELMALIRQSANRFETPDSLYGYGIPDFSKAMHIVAGDPDPGALAGLTVYPTLLASGQALHLETLRPLKTAAVRVHDLYGKDLGGFELQQLQGAARLPYDFSRLPAGTYIVSVQSGGRVARYRVIRY